MDSEVDAEANEEDREGDRDQIEFPDRGGRKRARPNQSDEKGRERRDYELPGAEGEVENHCDEHEAKYARSADVPC